MDHKIRGCLDLADLGRAVKHSSLLNWKSHERSRPAGTDPKQLVKLGQRFVDQQACKCRLEVKATRWSNIR